MANTEDKLKLKLPKDLDILEPSSELNKMKFNEKEETITWLGLIILDVQESDSTGRGWGGGR